MQNGFVRLLVGVIAAGAAIGAPARAQVDLAGDWLVTAPTSSTVFAIAQSGDVLSATANDTAWTGTVDTTTGAFSMHTTDASIAATLFCARVDGVVAPDGDHFNGTLESAPLSCVGLPPIRPTTCMCGTYTSEPVAGVRCTGACPVCGNGALEPGEQCDDGNTLDGDCCSPHCYTDPPGVSCTSDGNLCTYDLCNGSGTCLHQPNALACGSPCQPATCSGGACVAQGPAAAGTPCAPDGLACTYDGCDGAGQCTHGPRPACRAADRAAIGLRDDADGGRFRWTWKDDTGLTVLADFGLPTGTTAYRLCLFAGSSLLLDASAPAGTGCGSGACWTARSDGFAFKSPGSQPKGIGALKLRAAGDRSLVTARGSGPSVQFAGSLDVPHLRAQLVAEDAGRRCWEAEFTSPTLRTATQFTARQ